MNKTDAPGKIFLLHSKWPCFLGEILVFKSITEFEKFKLNPPKKYFYNVNGEKLMESIHFEYKEKIVSLFIIELYDNPYSSNGESKLSVMMKRTKGWLRAYYNSF